MSATSDRLLKALAFEIEQLEVKLRDANDIERMERERRRKLELRVRELEDELAESDSA